MARVLVVEDDDTLSLSIQLALEASGHSVRCAATLASARLALDEAPPELIVLDLALPDGEGLELCIALRARGDRVPILILTARGTLDARVNGLRAGADDYLPKPFEVAELLARVDALARRASWQGAGDRFTVGRLEVDFAGRRAWRDGAPFELTDLEMRLIKHLADRAPQVVQRGELLRTVWGVSPGTRTRTIDVFVSRLRRALEPDPAAPRYLVSKRGVGYRLVLER